MYSFTVNVLFVGAQHQWLSRQCQATWRALVNEGGSILFEWFDLCLRSAFYDHLTEFEAADVGPEKPHVKTNNRVQYEFLEKTRAPECTEAISWLSSDDLKRLFAPVQLSWLNCIWGKRVRQPNSTAGTSRALTQTNEKMAMARWPGHGCKIGLLRC